MISFYKKENTEPEIASKKVEVNNYEAETAIHLKRECKCFDQIKINEKHKKYRPDFLMVLIKQFHHFFNFYFTITSPAWLE